MSVRARTVLVLNVGSTSLKSACYSLRVNAETEDPAAHEAGRISIESTHDPSAVPEDHARKLLAQVAGVCPTWAIHPTWLPTGSCMVEIAPILWS